MSLPACCYHDMIFQSRGSWFETVEALCCFNGQDTLTSASCADPGIFRQWGGGGGVQVSLTKTALTTFFLVHSLFYRSQMVNFKEIYNFQGSRGVQHFAEVGGGSPTFFQERSNCFFSIETHISCDFPGGGGVRTPCPLSGSALVPSYGSPKGDMKIVLKSL